jgi:ligand-binding sensor domain-containing protein/signal transduction histidine kinase
MPIRLSFWLVLSFLYVWHPGQAQFSAFNNQLFFKKINTKDGLSQASVNCILHDSKGFMWFGTEDGLNRYDGSKFRIFRNIPGDSSSLIGNNIQSLLEDHDGNIWIGTSEGLSRFDRHREKFTMYPLKGNDYYSCFDIHLDSVKSQLWLSSGLDGVCYLDMKTGVIHRFEHDRLKEENVLRIEKIGNTLYVGTQEHGIITINVETKQSEDITLAKLNGMTVKPPIRALQADGSALWVGTEGMGVFRINTETKDVKSFTKKDGLLSDDDVWAIAITHDKKLWFGTDGGGATLLDSETMKAIFFTHSDYNNNTLSSKTIRSIQIDRNHDVWFGTFNGGVNYYSNFNINFLSFRKDPLDPASLSHNAVLSFCERNGNLYVGTDGGGLNYLSNGKFQRYQFPAGMEPPSVILCLRNTRNGGMMIGTYQGGLYFISADNRVQRFKNNPADSTTISSDIVWDIAEDADGNFWLATELGLNRLNTATGDFTHYKNRRPEDSPEVFNNDYMQSILIDSEQALWAGLYGILMTYDLKTQTVKRYMGYFSKDGYIPNKQILSLRPDPREKGVIWFSARGEALVRFDKKTEKVKLITEQEGLPNNLVFALEFDTKGDVWLSTNKGLVQYSPATNEFFTFDESFGVDIEPFNDNAAHRSAQGYMLFGGANGFTAFKPSEINLNNRKFKVTFTSFQLFNDEVEIDKKILDKSIGETDVIELPYDKARFITFEFSALQCRSPSSIRYQYMLEGFDTAWHEADEKRVSFMNLLPRDYKLHVRAGYGHNVWGDDHVLAIHVIPAWWMTWSARVAALLLFLFMGYAFFRYRTYKLKQRKLELEKIVAEQNREIRHKNMELESQNEELTQHNEELLSSRETISLQNQMLNDAHQKLQEINQSLEFLVQQRTEKLNETINRLNKTIKELDAFLYSASHDLVAPLKSVLGLVNLARVENSNQSLNSYFDHIETTVRKLEGVIHTLMQHSYNAKGVSQKQEIDMNALVRESISELQFMPEAKRLKFELALNDAIVKTDIPRMKIILSNLIGNAIKYHDPRKEVNTVSIQYVRNGQHWKLVLQDNGIGIQESRMNRIFDMFYRATESAKGSGLGLYIVKETVERLEGEIKVESEYGFWTRFTLTFPINENVLADSSLF